MHSTSDIVITGIGIVSPIGHNADTFWSALAEGRSGIRPISLYDIDEPARPICGECDEFDAKDYIRRRKSTKKSLKVMSRDIQMAYVAAYKACESASLDTEAGDIDPERIGVLFGSDLLGIEVEELLGAYQKCIENGQVDFDKWGGAMSEIAPLWMLKYLPNMPACHIAIGHDCRGPNNSVTLGQVSGLAAMSEAYRTIERGMADIIIAGAASSWIYPYVWARRNSYERSERTDDPTGACRPFDADRDGMVHAEGAGSLIIESAASAERRGVKPLARIRSFAQRFKWHGQNEPPHSDSIAGTISATLDMAGMKPEDIGHVNAEGVSTIGDDQAEAQAIHKVLGDVPVTAPKSYFGNMQAASGCVEAVASVLGLQKGLVPPTLNYTTPDEACPVNVVSGEPLSGTAPTAMLLNHCRFGRSAAMVIEKV